MTDQRRLVQVQRKKTGSALEHQFREVESSASMGAPGLAFETWESNYPFPSICHLERGAVGVSGDRSSSQGLGGAKDLQFDIPASRQ